ncbi:MAG: hypothetical protein D6772_08525 [Bacteroidetes bacterium]|nr:MAG: hypothetical protein D6772_08525 [Bacteroidota bacterium]
MPSTFLCLFLALVVFSMDMDAQTAPPLNEAQFEEQYEWRVRQERLYGVYIPADLADVFVQLNQKSDANGRASFKALSEQQAATLPFFSLGRWMAVNWGFYGGSRLTAYLNQMGLHHPDDMIRFLLVMYHRHLNKVPLDPKPVLEELLETRQQAEVSRLLENGEILYEETRPRKVDGGL